MANLRTNNLSGEQGQNAYRGSVYFRGYIDGTAADFLSVPASDDLDMGTGDFTLECWVRAAESSGEYAGILGMHTYSTNGFVFQIGHTGKLRIVNPNYLGHDDSTVTGSTVIIPQDGTFGDWHHLAVVRSSGTIKGYVNGVEEVSFSYSSGVDFANGGAAVIGATSQVTHPGDYDLKGYLSNLRLIKGTALYTTNYFTPPTSELTIVDGTVLLCCQDSDDPTQEATGKTITANGFTDLTNRTDNLIKNGRFTASATANWTLTGGTAVLGTGQSSAFGDGNHLVLTASSSYAYLYQAFTTVVGRTYRVNAQSNGADASYISTTTDENDAIITDIRSTVQTKDGRVASKNFIATQTTYYVILRAGTGGGNFDSVSVYEEKNEVQPKVIPPYGVDAGNAFGGPIQQSSEGYMYFPTGRTEERGRGRAVFGGGANPSITDFIDYVHIPSGGNAITFGNLINQGNSNFGLSSSTRGLWAGGRQPTASNIIEFVTLSNTSNTTDFGDLTEARFHGGSVSNSTRGVFMAGGTPTAKNVMDFVTIASAGNATDFGDTLTAGNTNGGGRSSSTRGILAGGMTSSPTIANTIEFITIATTGNSQDFGDLTLASRGLGAGNVSSGTRAVLMGGYTDPAFTNVISFVTIASVGNATDFGDISSVRGGGGSASTLTRGILAGGRTPTDVNTIDAVIISTTGNSTDFGDLTQARAFQPSGCSDSHGGLT